MASGEYELFMYTGTDGTIKIKDTPIWSGSVGNVNLNTREMVFGDDNYRP